ncbi:endonuclease MutS2 [Siphonobacter aquaeclarae]|uniref:Endonuclease MutS2 n=1 Tax=Siphonobacter aquaeclarae TaxID=563176 RepID=A0A1G9PPU7_9BACT|nr:Smr/MutS family protein [Siphonobacter aquaeclarae]SDM00511.1 DNA mismatch repair protein MutS2 [Siphonobacter aquaeclarae]
MLYPKNIEEKIGFDRIRQWLNEACLSPLGRSFVEKIRFSDRPDLIRKMTGQVAEMKDIIALEPEFPQQNYIDATEQLAKARIEGAFLTEEEFFGLKLSLRTIQSIVRFFEAKEEPSFPYLRELIVQAFPSETGTKKGEELSALLKDIDRIIDDRGRLRDNASPELQHIRRELIAEQARLRKTLESMLRTAVSNGWVPEGASMTVRNGRMVIPLVAEHKRKIKGFVQDESDSGKTVFLEPADALEANNEIRELESRERREIIRILTDLTGKVRPYADELKRAFTFLGLVDFIRAKARLALDLGASAPFFEAKPLVDWREARHPLLFQSFRKQGRSVVPLNVKLDEPRRILLVSGPNAGGKSVMLKTIGLIQYMFQCGLLVPVADHSTMGLFRNLFLDIGDEQSLENDLSTYSSHLTNMKHFLLHADKKTLFLIDEFGTGTEPSLGGAIAESILQELNKSGAYGVINTHYSNLKTFADRTEGLVNGAMRFDAEHLEPLYELETGKPGSSFAFEIGRKIGLPKGVLDAARQKLDRHQVNFEKLSKELEIERKVFQDRNSQNLQRQQELDQLTAQYQTLKTYLETEKKRLLNEAKVQAKELVREANAKIENTIREIREQGAEKLATKEIRQQLVDFSQEKLKEEKIEKPKPAKKEEAEIEVVGGEISTGSLVRVKGQSTVGEVLEMKGKDAVVAIGDLRTTLKVNRLEKVSRREFKAATGDEKPRAKLTGVDFNEKAINFSFNLDIRGKRGEEAMVEVDHFMDDAIMLGYPELRIVHGKGDGILRQLIRNHLRGYSQVAAMTDEHADRGGAGVTVVRMK